ncbi:MAG TPA: DUF58 domain-containing protein [Burkholderiales bacterium]|nr:DUF58 domain-containing protein [Burkholderiales bacterium]
MLIPNPRFIWLAAVLVALGVVVSIVPALAAIWIIAAALLVAFAAVDGLAARQIRAPEARRVLPGSLPLGVAHDVVLRLANQSTAAVVCDVYDHYPAGVEPKGLPQRVSVPAQGWAEIRYSVRPLKRGEIEFGLVELRLASRAGLWQVRRRVGEATTTRVYPNFAALTKFALLATDNRLSQIGVLKRRRRGEGLDFHQLREYREGDAQRQIDWKATARMRRLVSREYQDERDQQVVLLVDCGRRMAAQDGDLAHFDHVLNAALLLAYVGLRQGDAVGFLTMSGLPRWLAPRKARATVNLILNRVYDLHPTLQTTDYYSAALELMKRLRKRALVVILSNLRDEDDDTLAPALGLLQSRHLVLFASLREQILSRALTSRADTFDRALTHAATADYLQRRELAFRRLERGGAVCLDVEPADLPIALVNRYLDIKRTGRL